MEEGEGGAFGTFLGGVFFHVALSIAITVCGGIGISWTKHFAEFAEGSTTAAVSVLSVAIALTWISSIYWILGFFLKHKWVKILSIIKEIIFALLFLALMIVTSIAIVHWVDADWTKEVIEGRQKEEIEIGCCYARELNGDDTGKLLGATVYGDCPFVTDGRLRVDKESCDKLDETSVCEVLESELESKYLCGEKLYENTAMLIAVAVLDGVEILFSIFFIVYIILKLIDFW